jgi:hypothetical protein
MQISNRFSGLIATAMAVAALLLFSFSAVNGENRQTLTGTWLTWIEPQPGVRLPMLQTFTSDGMILSSDAMSGVPGAAIRMSPVHGVWERTGPSRFASTNLSLLFDAASGTFFGFARSRAAFSFTGKNADEGSGTVFVELLQCSSPFMCPDPQDPDADWQPFSPYAIKWTATRLRLVQPPLP